MGNKKFALIGALIIVLALVQPIDLRSVTKSEGRLKEVVVGDTPHVDPDDGSLWYPTDNIEDPRTNPRSRGQGQMSPKDYPNEPGSGSSGSSMSSSDPTYEYWVQHIRGVFNKWGYEREDIPQPFGTKDPSSIPKVPPPTDLADILRGITKLDQGLPRDLKKVLETFLQRAASQGQYPAALKMVDKHLSEMKADRYSGDLNRVDGHLADMKADRYNSDFNKIDQHLADMKADRYSDDMNKVDQDLEAMKAGRYSDDINTIDQHLTEMKANQYSDDSQENDHQLAELEKEIAELNVHHHEDQQLNEIDRDTQELQSGLTNDEDIKRLDAELAALEATLPQTDQTEELIHGLNKEIEAMKAEESLMNQEAEIKEIGRHISEMKSALARGKLKKGNEERYRPDQDVGPVRPTHRPSTTTGPQTSRLKGADSGKSKTIANPDNSQRYTVLCEGDFQDCSKGHMMEGADSYSTNQHPKLSEATNAFGKNPNPSGLNGPPPIDDGSYLKDKEAIDKLIIDMDKLIADSAVIADPSQVSGDLEKSQEYLHQINALVHDLEAQAEKSVQDLKDKPCNKEKTSSRKGQNSSKATKKSKTSKTKNQGNQLNHESEKMKHQESEFHVKQSQLDNELDRLKTLVNEINVGSSPTRNEEDIKAVDQEMSRIHKLQGLETSEDTYSKSGMNHLDREISKMKNDESMSMPFENQDHNERLTHEIGKIQRSQAADAAQRNLDQISHHTQDMKLDDLQSSLYTGTQDVNYARLTQDIESMKHHKETQEHPALMKKINGLIQDVQKISTEDNGHPDLLQQKQQDDIKTEILELVKEYVKIDDDDTNPKTKDASEQENIRKLQEVERILADINQQSNLEWQRQIEHGAQQSLQHGKMNEMIQDLKAAHHDHTSFKKGEAFNNVLGQLQNYHQLIDEQIARIRDAGQGLKEDEESSHLDNILNSMKFEHKLNGMEQKAMTDLYPQPMTGGQDRTLAHVDQELHKMRDEQKAANVVKVLGGSPMLPHKKGISHSVQKQQLNSELARINQIKDQIKSDHLNEEFGKTQGETAQFHSEQEMKKIHNLHNFMAEDEVKERARQQLEYDKDQEEFKTINSAIEATKRRNKVTHGHHDHDLRGGEVHAAHALQKSLHDLDKIQNEIAKESHVFNLGPTMNHDAQIRQLDQIIQQEHKMTGTGSNFQRNEQRTPPAGNQQNLDFQRRYQELKKKSGLEWKD